MSELNYLKTPQKYLMDGCKLIYYQDKLKDFLEGKRIMPITIDMGIHKGCNIRCVYCYGIFQKKSTQYIPEDRLLMLAEDASKVGVKGVAIVGDGEPTLNKGLYAFTLRLKSLGVDSAVATNGLLLKDWQIKILTECCTWLRFNISGINKYDSIMGAPKGSLAQLEEIIEYSVVHKGKCTVGLQTVLIPEGFSEIIPLARFAVDMGVDYLVIKQFSDPEESIPVHFDMDEYNKAVDALRRAESMTTERTKIIIKWGAIHDSTNITKHRKWDFECCNDLPFLFQMSGDGGCYPCGYLFGDDRYCYGNICDSRLSDILLSERYWEVVKKVANTPLEKLCRGQCRHCFSLQFMDKLIRIYKGNLRESLVELCGGEENYRATLENPPEHLSFI